MKKVIIFAKLDCAVDLLNSYGLLLCTILRALLGPSYWEWSVAATAFIGNESSSVKQALCVRVRSAEHLYSALIPLRYFYSDGHFASLFFQ